jgi:hypothetical protein
MRQPNTDSTPNKPLTLPRNQLLIRYAGTSLVHTGTIRGNVTCVYPLIQLCIFVDYFSAKRTVRGIIEVLVVVFESLLM